MFVDQQHHGGPHWSSHGRLHQDRSAKGSTSCHGIPRACGTAQDYGCFGPVWQTGTFLGLIHHKVHGGYTIQTDTETLLAGLRDLNLEHCKPSKLPGATPQTHDLTPLDPSEHKLYRRVVGRFLYCSAHRGDFALTLNQLCRRVQSPTVSDMQALRKLARYIKGTLHYKLNIRPRHNTDLKIEFYTDADWAGQSDRHSITGGLLVLDGVNVSSWARTQKAIATSSGESELYAMSVGAAEALGLRELLTDIGLPTTVRLRCDSTAAMGTASRQGLGRMKHVQVRDLACNNGLQMAV